MKRTRPQKPEPTEAELAGRRMKRLIEDCVGPGFNESVQARMAELDVVERLAWALAYDFSVAKQGTPRKIFRAQTDGCQERFRESAAGLLDAMKKSGLVVSLRGKK